MIDRSSVLKIADFGLATPIEDDFSFSDKIGTNAYIAPEIHQCELYNAEPVDIFATGVVLFTMVVGHRPFMEAT